MSVPLYLKFYYCTRKTKIYIQTDIHKLAIDKFGSRVLEVIWNCVCVDLELRMLIAEVLMKKETVLVKDFFGRIIWVKFGLKFFKDQSKWKKEYGGDSIT